jgi:dsRNA-specific ribonuclease
VQADEKDAVSWLQRHAHAMKWELPVYVEEGRIGEAHEPTFTVRVNVGPVTVTANGSNKKLAKQNAARAAMTAAKAEGLLPDYKPAAVRVVWGDK